MTQIRKNKFVKNVESQPELGKKIVEQILSKDLFNI